MQENLLPFEFESVIVDKNGLIIKRQNKIARSFTLKLGSKTKLEMVEIPSGSFTMGSYPNEIEFRANEQPAHQVNVPSFFIGKFPVTQSQWVAIMKILPKMSNKFYGDDLPVVNVWLEKALEFCSRLKLLADLAFRLPTEAEWEYACRAGTTTAFNCGETLTTELANFDGNKPYDNSPMGTFRNQTTPVGYFKAANQFGLFDMHGNVWEWCADIWHEDYNGAPTDGSAWLTNGDQSYCVQRGGSWLNRAGACRSNFRVGDIAHNADSVVGLRVCLSNTRD